MAASSATRLSRFFVKASPTPTPTPTPNNTTSLTHNEIVDQLFKERNLIKLVRNFKKHSEIDKFRKRHGIYEDTVRRLALAKKFDSIKDILEHQKKYPDITTEGFAVRLISLYGKAGMLENAHQTFDQMPQLKCERTVKSFNALLHACNQTKQFTTAVKLFRQLPLSLSIVPDLRSYNTVIQSLCELRSLDSAYGMLDEMDSKGVKPSFITFNILMNGFYSHAQFGDGEKVWARMEENGFVPDIVSFNSKLGGLLGIGKISKAVELLEEIKSRELKPTVITYNVLIQWYCKSGNLDEAKRMYDSLLKDDCVPNRATFQALIPCTYEKGDLDLALLLCNECVDAYCFIDVAILHTVVDGLMKASRVEDAEKLVALAKSKKYSRSKLKVTSEDE